MKKIEIAAVGVPVLAILFGCSYYWWYSTPPRRPASVPRSAIYYPGLALPFGIGQAGLWVNCWFDQRQHADVCRNTSVNGHTLYEGVYLSYSNRPSLQGAELDIDARKTEEAQEQFGLNVSAAASANPGLQVVPLLYLRDGDVLFPEKISEQARKRLEDLRAANSPYSSQTR